MRRAPRLFWIHALAISALAGNLVACDQQTAQAALGPSALGSSSKQRPDASKARAPGSKSQAALEVDPETGCPLEMARVHAYCVDRYEAHLWRQEEDASLVLHPSYERPLGPARYWAKSREGVRPQAYISQVEARAACENAGKRLCSAEEWFTACQGSKRTTYPYGPRFERKRCNVGKPHLLSRWFGANSGAWRYEEHFNDPRLDQEPGFLALTGEYAGCVSDYGVYDMVGNLHEWVSDRADLSLAKKLPLKAEIRNSLRRRGGNGVFLGGFFSTTHEHGPGCTFATLAHEPTYHDYSTGFRCCKDPER